LPVNERPTIRCDGDRCPITDESMTGNCGRTGGRRPTSPRGALHPRFVKNCREFNLIGVGVMFAVLRDLARERRQRAEFQRVLRAAEPRQRAELLIFAQRQR
jgi:hypothetical protein